MQKQISENYNSAGGKFNSSKLSVNFTDDPNLHLSIGHATIINPKVDNDGYFSGILFDKYDFDHIKDGGYSLNKSANNFFYWLQENKLRKVFLAHYAILGIALFGIFLIYGYFGDESLKRDIIIYIALIFFFIFSVLRLFCLPILYSKLEQKSSNPVVLKLISLLKTNRVFRYELVIFIILVDSSWFLEAPFVGFISILALYTLFLSSSLSYIVLFCWWKYKGELK